MKKERKQVSLSTSFIGVFIAKVMKTFGKYIQNFFLMLCKHLKLYEKGWEKKMELKNDKL